MSTPYAWTYVDSSPAQGRTFVRDLGPLETSFYYDRIFNGTADIVWRYTIELANPARGDAIFGEQNVARAWTTLKQYYPLLGARMEPKENDTVIFAVTERSLSHHLQDEVVLRTVSTPSEVEKVVWYNIRDNPMENSHITAQVFVFALADQPGVFEVLFKAAHAITDGISGATLARTFLDVLCSPPIKVPALEERLAMALPPDALNPTLKMSVARQRWRRAIGKITVLNSRKKLTGGHTIPRTITEKTYCTPSRTQRSFLRLNPSETRTILASCRRHKVTFGSIIPVLSQMALTRFLHRRYLRGDITEAEWEHRRRQPMHYG